MNLLLDTHAFIWFLDGDSKLSGLARQTIENPENKIYISTASIWEISIKQSLNKIILKGTLNDMKE